MTRQKAEQGSREISERHSESRSGTGNRGGKESRSIQVSGRRGRWQGCRGVSRAKENRRGSEMEVDEADIEKSYCSALREDFPGLEGDVVAGSIEEGLECQECSHCDRSVEVLVGGEVQQKWRELHKTESHE